MLYNEDTMPYGLDNDIDINITNQNINSNEIMGGYSNMGQPIMEMPRERCIYRNIVHEVPHVYFFM